jgi:hypothetical protein
LTRTAENNIINNHERWLKWVAIGYQRKIERLTESG